MILLRNWHCKPLQLATPSTTIDYRRPYSRAMSDQPIDHRKLRRVIVLSGLTGAGIGLIVALRFFILPILVAPPNRDPIGDGGPNYLSFGLVVLIGAFVGSIAGWFFVSIANPREIKYWYPINACLFEVFRSHGVFGAYRDEWVALPNRMRVSGEVVRWNRYRGVTDVELDVCFEFKPGHAIVESFVGRGRTYEQAVDFAFRRFAIDVLHVLLSAFCQSDCGDQVRKEDWTIGGSARRVNIGYVGIVGNPPVHNEHGVKLQACFDQFEDRLRRTSLPSGTHWVRLYYCQVERQTYAFDVLLDNEVWSEIQSEVAALDWPVADDFFAVRNFLVIQDN
jgi:Family of unknown function (DUF6348)